MSRISTICLSLILAAGLASCIHKEYSQVEAQYSAKRTISAVNGKGKGFIQTNGIPAVQKTFFSLRSDDEKIYITAECLFPNGKQLRVCGSKPDDMALFAGEHVEIFLCTDPAKGIYYQFALSPNGCVYTALGHDKTWEPAGWTKKIRMGKDRWTIELALPYRIFGITKPAKDEVWGFNICRTYAPVKGKAESANWCGLADYHEHRKFNRIVFGTVKPVPQVILNDFVIDEKGTVRADFDLENIADPALVNIQCGMQEYTKKAAPNTAKCIMLCNFNRVYVPLKDDIAFSILVTNERTGKLIFRHDIGSDRDYSNLLLPDKLYYVPSDKNISFTLNSCGIPAMQKQPVFTVSLSANKIVYRKQNFRNKGTFSLTGLKPGRYVLEAVNGRLKTSRVIYYQDKYDPISGLPPKSAFRIRENIFTADNVPVFLAGGSTTDKPLPKEISFNLIAGNFGNARNSVPLYSMGGKRYNRSLSCYLYPYAGKEEFFRFIDKRMKQFDRTSPKIIRLTYEAHIKTRFQKKGGPLVAFDSAQWHKEFYAYVKKHYPEFYYSLQTDRQGCIPDYAPHCDVFEVTPQGGYFQVMLPSLMKTLPEAIRIAGKKPVICWLGATIPNNMCRAAEELRGAVFYNIIHDSAGVIFHLGHGALPQFRTRIWSLIKHINGEIQEFYPAFRAMPLLDAKAAARVLKIRGKNYVCAVRGNGKEAIAVVLNVRSSENILNFQAGNGYIVTDRYGISSPAGFEWCATPYEAVVLRLHKK